MNKQTVTETAIKMVRESGLINLSRYELCERSGIPDGSFPNVMGCTFTEFVETLKEMNITIDNYHPVVKTRTNPSLREEQILIVAVNLAKDIGYNKLTRDQIAEHAGVSMGLVTRYFNTMNQLKRDVMRYAIKNEIPEIVAQGLALGDKHAKKSSSSLKKKAGLLIANC